jgi:hypothetical protein
MKGKEMHNLYLFNGYTGYEDKNGKPIYTGTELLDSTRNVYEAIFDKEVGLYAIINKTHGTIEYLNEKVSMQLLVIEETEQVWS